MESRVEFFCELAHKQKEMSEKVVEEGIEDRASVDTGGRDAEAKRCIQEKAG
jgi:hypothetical protein